MILKCRTILTVLSLALVASLTSALSIGPINLFPDRAPTSPGVRLLFQNDLHWDQVGRKAGRLLIESIQTYKEAAAACQALSEQLATVPVTDADFQKQLRYLVFKGSYAEGQKFWVGNADLQTIQIRKDGTWTLSSNTSESSRLPAICTQSAPRRQANHSDVSAKWHVSVGASADTRSLVTGYRDALSFRFWALPYADETERFAYSSIYSGQRDIDATGTSRSKQCPQRAGTDSTYTEDCLVLSLFTPYLPPQNATLGKPKDLRPIMVWIHGGGFNTGSGLDFTFDGGQMSSRGDVVVVNVNYRLGTFGFLAYNDQIKGNFGVGDVVTALRWVQKHAATFGGDASRVTIAGQSAGANIVEHLIGSPAASGLFHRAIIQSGRPADQYNARSTVAEARAKSTNSIVNSLGCADASDVLACLRKVDVENILSARAFSQPVVDGRIITTKKYVLSGSGGHVNKVPTIIGFMRDELASLGFVPSADQTNLTQALIDAGVPAADRDIVLSQKQIFSTQIPNGIQNLTVTVETNNQTVSRCGIAATAYSAVSKGVLSDVWAYTQDQRAFQIPNYDPNAVCQPKGRADASDGTAYYFCHSGDLLPTFATAEYGFGLGPRDTADVTWVRNQIDQWTAMVRKGNPNPSAAYTAARGYASVSGADWPKVSSSAQQAQLISLGPTQKRRPLAQHSAQCEAIGRGLDYIARGG